MKTKKKNQNKIIKIASALMILCLMTTCAISATFAKYATTDSTEDTARVAKWGVVLSASGTLFGKNYAANGATGSNAIIALGTSQAASTHSVVAGAKAVAPGTKNDVGVELKLTGTPEVAFSVAASTTSNDLKDIYLKAGTYGVMVVAYGLNAETDITQYYVLGNDGSYTLVTGSYVAGTTYYKLLDYVELEDDYYPVVWSLSKNGAAATEHNNVTALTDAIMSYVNGTTTTTTGEGDEAVTTTTINPKRDYDANHALNDTYKITWAWEFNNGNDGADTILGNIGYTTVVELGEDGTTYSAISADSYSLNVAFNITIIAEQID